MDPNQYKLKILGWLAENQIKTNKDQLVEFVDHNFLLDYVTDPCNRIVVQKPTQVGVSTGTLFKAFFAGDQQPLNVIYTLPTNSDVRDFVTGKVDPIIERSAGLLKKVVKVAIKKKEVYSTYLKRIGPSYFFFRGSWVAWKAQSIDADILIVDELDFQKPEIRQMYEERLDGSKSQDIIYWVGYPSIPGYGIADLYEQSDQREWWIECPECKKQQVLLFPENISFQKKTFVCKFCRKDLTDDARRKGKWVAKFPGRKIHGYAMNKLMAPWITADRIIKSFKEDTPKHFYNYTLGLPYIEKAAQLSDQILRNATLDTRTFEGKFLPAQTVVGIDQGGRFQMVVGKVSKYGAVATECEIYDSVADVEKRLDALKPVLTVMDMAPDFHIGKLLQDKYGRDKFILGNLKQWTEASAMKGAYELKRSTGMINMERTETLDCMFESIKSCDIKFLDSTNNLSMLFQHLKALIPDYQERFGKVRKVWKRVGKDDLAHALNFFWAGAQMLYPKFTSFDEGVLAPEEEEMDFYSQIKGSKNWLERDFAQRVERLRNPDGYMVIPPKNFT